MSALPVIEQLPVDAISIVRLHGLACITCGTASGPLLDAGHIGTRDSEGGVLSWRVVTCVTCRESA
jgi:hypothetical protein